MARIYYMKLNNELKKAINEKTISEADLKKVYDKFMESRAKKKKTIDIVMAIVIAMFAIMTIPMLNKAGDPRLTKFMLTFIIPVLIVIYVLIYFTQIGLVKTQFDNAIRKNYPNLAKELGL